MEQLEPQMISWIATNFDSLLPEEICLVLSRFQTKFESRATQFLYENMHEMNMDEALRIAVLLKSHEFIGQYFKNNI
jgi:hypothetical protein